MALVGELQRRDIDRLGEFNEGEQQLNPCPAGEFVEVHPDQLAELGCRRLVFVVAHLFRPGSYTDNRGACRGYDAVRVAARWLSQAWASVIFARLSVCESKRCDDRARADADLRS